MSVSSGEAVDRHVGQPAFVTHPPNALASTPRVASPHSGSKQYPSTLITR